MKYLIPLLIFSSLTFASDVKIPQNIVDKHFNFCLSDAQKTDQQQEICDKFWVPYGTGERVSYSDLYDLKDKYSFDPEYYDEEAEKYTKEPKINQALCKSLVEKVKVTKQDEFGNRFLIKKERWELELEKKLLNKTDKERELILVKNEARNTSCIRNDLLKDNLIKISLFTNQYVKMMVDAGKLPASINISLPDKKTKKGYVTISVDTSGFFKRLMIYLEANKNRQTMKKRLSLIAAFVSMNGYSIPPDGYYDQYGTLIYYIAQDGNPNALKLITIIANGDNFEISKYLMSIPNVNIYSEIFLKEYKQ